jgi:hypothetical protein
MRRLLDRGGQRRDEKKESRLNALSSHNLVSRFVSTSGAKRRI